MTDAALNTDPTTTRRRMAVGVVVVALLAAHATLSWVGRPTGIETAHDDARYVLLSQALSHASYAEPWRATHVVHSLYPPGYPAVLAVWGAVFGHGYAALAALSVVASTLALALAYLAAASCLSPAAALGALAALAFNPYLIIGAGTLLSEPVYMLWSVAVLALVGWGGQGRRLAAAAALAILAALTRSVGLTLVLALGAHLLLERRFRALAVFAAASLLTVGLWDLWSVRAPEQFAGGTYLADVLSTGHRAHGWARVLFESVKASGVDYFATALPYRLPVPTIPDTKLDNVLGALATVVGLAAGAALAWRRWRIAILYAAAYFGLLLVWPWKSGRFLVPLLPVAVPLTLAGWEWLAGRAGRRAGIATVAVVAAILAINGAWRVSGYVKQRMLCRHQPAPPAASACLSPGQINYLAAARYAQERLPKDAVVLASKGGTFYLYSGHRSPSFSAALAQDSLRFLDHIRSSGAGFVLLAGVLAADRARLAPLVRANCSALREEARFPPTAVLLRVPPVGEQDSTNACVAVADYLRANAGATFDVLGL